MLHQLAITYSNGIHIYEFERRFKEHFRKPLHLTGKSMRELLRKSVSVRFVEEEGPSGMVYPISASRVFGFWGFRVLGKEKSLKKIINIRW
eukprot:446160-Prorocentrum_minimum.AAC.4